MTIVDASALVTAAIGTDDRARVALVALDQDDLAAPAFVRTEFTSALRGETADGRVDPAAAGVALGWCLDLPITLHTFTPLADSTPGEADPILNDAPGRSVVTTRNRLIRVSAGRDARMGSMNRLCSPALRKAPDPCGCMRP